MSHSAWDAVAVLLIGGLALAVWWLYRCFTKVFRALQRAQQRMVHARWLIYRDWAEADAILGIGERDIAQVLHIDRPDVCRAVDPPTSDQLAMMIEAHRTTYPNQTYE